MKTLEILKAARTLIEKPENWTQGEMARDSGGCNAAPKSPDACRWCLAGAVIRCANYSRGWGLPLEVGHRNDRMTHPEAPAWLDRAIALVERRTRKKGARGTRP